MSTSPATQVCRFCGEEILAVAKKCRYCGSYLDPSARPRDPARSAVDKMLLPVGRPGTAIAAGYLALFGLIPVFGLVASVPAVVCGIMALKKINQDPSLSGKGRAWFGIIVGGAMTLFGVVMIVILVIGLIMEANKRGLD